MVNPRAYLAEGISSFALIFFGPLSVILSVVAFGDGLSIDSIIMISLGHGVVVALMVYAFGHVSGAHISTAVTIPMIITKKIGVKDGIAYIISQIIGGILATLSLQALFPEIGKQVFWGAHGGPSELIGNNMKDIASAIEGKRANTQFMGLDINLPVFSISSGLAVIFSLPNN